MLISKDEFLARMTRAEKREILTSPDKAQWGFLFDHAESNVVDIDDNRVVDAVRGIETAGLVRAGRANDMLRAKGGRPADPGANSQNPGRPADPGANNQNPGSPANPAKP